MTDTVAFDLVTPARLALSQDVEMVILPGEDGDLGVLPGHAPLIASLRPGTVCVVEKGAISNRLFVPGGFLEVTPERCTLLAEQAEPLDGIDDGQAAQRLAELRDELASAAASAPNRAALENAVTVAEARLAAVRNPAYA